MFSRRSRFPRTINRLSQAHASAAAESLPLLDLTISNPTMADLDLMPSLAALADVGGQRYSPDPRGLISARAAIAAHMAEHDVALHPDRTLLTASTSEAYALLFKLLCDAGDEVLVPAPSYPLLDHLLQLEHVRQVSYPLAYDGEWHLDADAIARRCTPRTRAIIVISPNNPTGSYLKRDELASLAALGLPIISDEVFGAYPLTADARRARTALEIDDVLVFSLFGLSKLIGMPQLKLAWVAVNGPRTSVDEAMARLDVIADSSLSVATPVQVALPALLAEGRHVTQSIRHRITDNWRWLTQRLPAGRTPIDLLRSEGGWYAVLRVPAVYTAEDWALLLLERGRVFAHPGYFYDFPNEAYLIVSLLTPPATLREGVSRLSNLVERHL